MAKNTYYLRFQKYEEAESNALRDPLMGSTRNYEPRLFANRPFPDYTDIELDADEFIELLSYAVRMRGFPKKELKK